MNSLNNTQYQYQFSGTPQYHPIPIPHPIVLLMSAPLPPIRPSIPKKAWSRFTAARKTHSYNSSVRPQQRDVLTSAKKTHNFSSTKYCFYRKNSPLTFKVKLRLILETYHVVKRDLAMQRINSKSYPHTLDHRNLIRPHLHLKSVNFKGMLC